ncbi:MAG: hypothetical protein ABMB14_37800 [Myxococcota bacterium]
MSYIDPCGGFGATVAAGGDLHRLPDLAVGAPARAGARPGVGRSRIYLSVDLGAGVCAP